MEGQPSYKQTLGRWFFTAWPVGTTALAAALLVQALRPPDVHLGLWQGLLLVVACLAGAALYSLVLVLAGAAVATALYLGLRRLLQAPLPTAVWAALAALLGAAVGALEIRTLPVQGRLLPLLAALAGATGGLAVPEAIRRRRAVAVLGCAAGVAATLAVSFLGNGA